MKNSTMAEFYLDCGPGLVLLHLATSCHDDLDSNSSNIRIAMQKFGELEMLKGH